jgi:putative oxidoreductase
MVEERVLLNHQATSMNRRGIAFPIKLARPRATFLLRLSLAAVFFWFGVLKLADVSPVTELLRGSLPFLARSPFIELLGVAEMIIAAGLVVDRLSKQAAVLMVLHLICTLGVVLISPSLVFAPRFPVLTMQGEFLAKNLVFIAAGLVVLFSNEAS